MVEEMVRADAVLGVNTEPNSATSPLLAIDAHSRLMART
jgi:hypothetical protein